VGARGPIGQSDNVRFLRGNPGHRRGRKTVKAAPGAPNPPTWLSVEAKAEWRRVVPLIDELGILGPADRAVLSLYVDAWARWVDVARRLDREELVRRERGHLAKTPLWQIYRDSSALVAQLARSIGASPDGRLRMNLPERPDDDAGDDILD
jgi:P27 family predicted phage terminase small subunit